MNYPTIHNCGTAANEYTYIIYRVVEGENWFWGATDDIAKASQIQAELGSNARIVESSKCNALMY